MDKWKKAYYIFIALGVFLAVVSFVALPELVTAQISAQGDGTRIPKIIAVLIPTVITAGGGIFGLVVLKKDYEMKESLKKRGLICSIMGVLFFGFILWINLFK